MPGFENVKNHSIDDLTTNIFWEGGTGMKNAIGFLAVHIASVLALTLVCGTSALAQVAFKSASSAASGSTSSFTINKPAGVVQSDLLIAQVTVNNGNDTSITSPRSR